MFQARKCFLTFYLSPQKESFQRGIGENLRRSFVGNTVGAAGWILEFPLLPHSNPLPPKCWPEHQQNRLTEQLTVPPPHNKLTGGLRLSGSLYFSFISLSPPPHTICCPELCSWLDICIYLLSPCPPPPHTISWPELCSWLAVVSTLPFFLSVWLCTRPFWVFAHCFVTPPSCDRKCLCTAAIRF